ncbi:MAG: hypothetical protein ACJ757_04280 [Gaiellaceae bacterium]
MARRLAIAVAVAGMLVLAPVAGATAGQWSVTGSGVGAGNVAGDHLELAARSDVGGATPSGYAEGQFSVGDAQYNDGGQVLCLNVVGNRAVIVWRLRFSVANTSNTFPYGAAVIEDNGEPVGGQPVDRMIDFVLSPPNLAFFCTPAAVTLLDVFGGVPIESGNFVVSDG